MNSLKDDRLAFYPGRFPFKKQNQLPGGNVMKDTRGLGDARTSDPFVDRRSGEDQRQAYDQDYFPEGGTERRSGKERRGSDERRESCVRVSNWSSVCPDN